MHTLPNCPKCQSEYTYEDGNLLICPECFHEWIPLSEEEEKEIEDRKLIRDANGNVLEDGDDVSVVKDLKVKGSSGSIKLGTRVKDIKLIHGASDGHDIDCRIDSFGFMKLKSEFVKKL